MNGAIIEIKGKGAYHIYEFDENFTIKKNQTIKADSSYSHTLHGDSKYATIFKDGEDRPVFLIKDSPDNEYNFSNWNDLDKESLIKIKKGFYFFYQLDETSHLAKLVAITKRAGNPNIKDGNLYDLNTGSITKSVVIDPIIKYNDKYYYVSNVESKAAIGNIFCKFSSSTKPCSITFNGPISLDDNAFNRMEVGYKIIFNQSVHGIGSNIFSNHNTDKGKTIKSIEFADGSAKIYSKIKEYAFNEARGITEIKLDLGDGCSVDKGIFKNCNSLNDITIGTESDNGCTLTGLLDEYNADQFKLQMKNIILSSTSLKTNGKPIQNNLIDGHWGITIEYSVGFEEKKKCNQVDGIISIDSSILAAPLLSFNDSREYPIDKLVYRFGSGFVGNAFVNGAQVVSLGTVTKAGSIIEIPDYVEYDGTKYQVVEIGRDEYRGTGIIDNEYIGTDGVPISDPLSFKLKLNSDVVINDDAFHYFKQWKDPNGFDRTTHLHTGLTSIENSSHIIKVGKRAFYNANITGVDFSNVGTIGEEAFYNANLTNFDFTNVSTIGKNAFYGCTNLASVDLCSVKSIGEQAFVKSGIKGDLSIPGGCKVGQYAFSGTGITKASISGILEPYVFANCKDLTSFEISGDKIVSGTFKGCTSLAEVNLHGISEIGDSAFSGCVGLSIINLSGVNKLGDNAFSGTGLTSVDVPSQITLTGKGHFQGCSKLSSVTFGPTKIPENCFSQCTVLSNIDLSVQDDERIITIGAGAFKGSSITSFAWDNVNEIGEGAFEGAGIAGSIDLSDIVFDGGSQFSGCSDITEVEMNQGSVPQSCFSNCGKLEAVKISNASSIGASAFDGCSTLDDVSIVNITLFGDYAFRGTSINGAIDLANAVTVGKEAFANTRITSLKTPVLESIGIGAFQECVSLEKIELGKKLATISEDSFRGCTSLKDADFSNTVDINEEAFRGCEKFCISNMGCSFDPKTVLGWSTTAFKDSGSMTSDAIDGTRGHYDYLIVQIAGKQRSFLVDIIIDGDIPKKESYRQTLRSDLQGIFSAVLESRITAVSISENDIYKTMDGALYEKGNNELTLIKVPWYYEYLEIDSDTTKIGKNSFKDSAITEVTVPSKVKIIDDSAFIMNKSLVSVHLQDGLERIGINAFSNCDIRSISIPSTVVHIEKQAFMGNNNLERVEFSIESKSIAIGSGAFSSGLYSEIFLPKIDGNEPIFSSALKTVYISQDFNIDQIGKIFDPSSVISFYVYAGVDVDKTSMNELGGCKSGSFGDYYIIIDGSIHTYSFRSPQIGGKHIYFISDVGDLDISDFKISGKEASFGISAKGGYSYHDLELDTDGNIRQHETGRYTIEVNDDVFVYVKERIPSNSFEITFDSNGGSAVASIRIGEGRTLLDSQYPIPTKDSMEFIGWFITDSVEFTEDTPVDENLRLKAHWKSASPLVTFQTGLGAIEASIDGASLLSGTRVVSGTAVTFKYVESDCSEFVEWIVSTNGSSSKVKDRVLTLVVANDLTVYVKERYSSPSSSLTPIISTDTPAFDEETELLWKTNFAVDTSMSKWTGHSSVPLIVDDHVYVRASDKIYMIEIETGFVEKSIQSVPMDEYYHYLGYAHGLIIDYSNGKVYDTDLVLKEQFNFTVSSVFFDDGSTYLYGDKTLYKYDPSLSECEWKSVLDRPIFGQYGTISSVVVEGDYIYYINAVEKGDRTICSIRTDNGQSAGSITLDEIYGFYMDDGWLTCYDDTLYVTAYTVGLFNSKVDDKDEGYVISIPISKGSFGEPTYTPTASRANSQFVVYNDRGYVNAGFSLFVFDIDKNDRTKLTKAYSVFTGFSHGGIVLNTGDATEDNNHEVLVYVIPYNPGSGLVIARDHAGQESGDVVTKSVGTHQYNSQAVRSTSDGKLIWYTDTGNIYCIGTARLNDYYFFIEDSNGSMWYHATGSTAADALSSLGSDVVTLNPSKELATVGGKTLGEWKIWGLKPSGDAMPTSSSGYEWKSLNSLYDSAYNEIHYFAISKAAPSNGTDYVYADGDELKGYKFSWNIGDRSLIGKPMTQGSSENVVTIRFYDDGTEIEGTCLIGEKGSSLSGSFPSIYRSGWSGTWVDADGNPATFPTQFPSENTKYRIVWTQNSYTIAGEKKQVGSATYFEVSVTRASGEKDVAEPRLLLIAEYSNGVFTNVFSDALSFDSTGNASKSMDVGVSTENLLKVHVYLVSGKPLGAFESYGEYVCEVSS